MEKLLNAYIRRVLVVIWVVYWFPYFTYTAVLHMSAFVIFITLVSRTEEWKFGYVYKILIKIYNKLMNVEELKMRGIKFGEAHDYICECDKEVPIEERTIFSVRFLTAPEQAKLRDTMYKISGTGAKRKEEFLTGTASLMALKWGLKGWKNFKFSDGTAIEFTEENFSCIPPTQRDEIANYIRGIEEEGEV